MHVQGCTCSNVQYHNEGSSSSTGYGKEFLRQVGAMPILMIQVHCLEIKIMVLDMPYCVYYWVCVLESFTISLNPFKVQRNWRSL